MRAPIRILVSEITLPESAETWGDIIDNWEAYAREWNSANQLDVFQSEAPILDMFGDESVSIKQVVKDMKDPKKLFTDYSRSFTVPASKKNNAIFKHYYNIEIQDGFDSRELVPCRILMGNTTYKIGNLSLESVIMSEGVARGYKLRFVGKLSELARKIGQDELTALDLGKYNIDQMDAKAEFQTPAANDLVFPLASRSKRFLVHSSDAQYVNTAGLENAKNIRYTTSTAHDPNIYGINETDLVGAMKVGTILDEIELKYGVNFQGVFTRDYVRFMYLWLHKARKESNDEGYSYVMSNISPQTPPANANSNFVVNSSNISIGNVPQDIAYTVQVKGTWTGSGRAVLYKDGQEVASTDTTNVSSGPVWVTRDADGGEDFGSGVYHAELKDFTTSQTTATLEIIVDEYLITIPQGEIYPEPVFDASYSYTETNIDIGDYLKYIISQHIPKMKVMDFLGSLFKMFNIIAEVDENLNIQTRHHDAYMSEGVVRDITQWVDQSKYEVKKPNLYSSIRFKYEEPKTALEQGFLAVNAREYGELAYQLDGLTGVKLSGDEYKHKMNNQLIPVERLVNIQSGTLTRVAYVNFADLKGAEQEHKPAFTYIASKTGATGLAWNDGTTVTQVTNYAQSVSLFNDNTEPTSVLDGYVGLFFGEEQNEQQLNKQVVGFGLFNNFFRGLTAMVFDDNTRSVSFEAHLPARVLLQLKPSDTLYISGKFYMINSIETDYLSGKSKLDLTLTGRSKLPFFQKKSFNVTNNSASDLRVTYINWNGFIEATTIATTVTTQIDCIGQISTFSNEFYSIVEL